MTELNINSNNVLFEIRSKNGILDKLNQFDESLDQQALYLRTFMRMYESLLMFVRATCQGLWKLHLSSLNCFVKYFFAINYARILYLANMYSLQTEDSNIESTLK